LSANRSINTTNSFNKNMLDRQYSMNNI
jgi:hypothetical protein